MTNTSLFKASARVAGMATSPTLFINELVAYKRRNQERVFHFGFGESPFPVPKRLQDVLAQHAGENSYPPTKGMASLCEKALSYFAKRFHFDATGMQTLVGPGSKDILFAAQMAIDGDILLPTPSWVSYAPQAQLVGTTAIALPTQAQNNHHFDGHLVESVIKEARAKGLNPTKILLNYPNNPTGLGFSDDELRHIAEVCRTYGVIVISDEIYALTSRGKHTSIASYYPEGTIVTTGLSKHLSLGGFRIGFGFIPDALSGLMEAMAAVASETWSGVSHPMQYVALEAVAGHDDIERHIQNCTKVHALTTDYLRMRVNDLGLNYPELAGAFYLYPNFEPYRDMLATSYGIQTSDDLAHDLLKRANIATLPGSCFGDPADVLTLRMATTDYDGGEALAYFEAHPNCTALELVTQCCPNLKHGMDQMSLYLNRKG